MDKMKKTKWEGTGMKKLKKGFTLIELMIVVAIIAILAAVAAPKMASQLKKAKDAKALAVLGASRSASSIYYADNDGSYPGGMDDIYDLVDSGAKRVFATTSSGLSATLDVGSNFDGTGATTSSATVPIVLVDSSGDSVTSVGYGEGELYLGDANDEDTKRNVWSEY